MKSDPQRNLIVARMNSKPIEFIDPASIQYTYQANIVRALYSGLVVFDKDGNLQTCLAESFHIDGNILTFVLPEKPWMSSSPVTAEDVKSSYGRLMDRNTNTHGNLDWFLVDGKNSIQAQGNRVRFELKKAEFAKAFLPLLASADFGVIPKNAIDWSSPDLPIRDYHSTSGPFFYKETDGDDLVLLQNPGHPLLTPHSPTEIRVRNIPADKLADAVGSGTVDLVPTFYPTSVSLNLASQLRTIAQYSPYKSLPIRTLGIHFSEKALKTFTEEERRSAAEEIRENYLNLFTDKDSLSATRQFFSPAGEGQIDESQLPPLSHPGPKESSSIAGNRKIRVLDQSHASSDASKFYASFSQSRKVEAATNESDADAFIFGTDSGFYDSISMLAYLQSQHLFGLSEVQFSKWIDEYLRTEDAIARRTQIEELHLQMLRHGMIVPIALTHYFGFSKHPWKMEICPLYAGTPLWMISKRD